MFTSKDFQFQGYSIPKDKKQYTFMQIKKLERDAEYLSTIEHTELSGEQNEFLELNLQQVIIYHANAR